MKVLIIGSSRGLVGDREAEFRKACGQIGVALAESGMGIVVASESSRVADRWVVEGVKEVANRPTVILIRPNDYETPFLDGLAASKIKLISRRVRGSWLGGRVPLILEADAVLLIGGGKFTLNTGYMAAALEKPVLAVGSFGGAAKTFSNELQPYYQELGPVSSDIGALAGRWSDGCATLVVSALKELVRRGAFRTKPRLPFGLYMGLMMLCLVSWVVAFNSDAIPYSYSLFIILGVAGLLGTMLRNNLRLVFDPTARFSWNELLIEVGAGLLLAFALALLYLVGAVTIKGSAEIMFPTGPAEFQRVAVVMTLLGLGGGLMIEQAADRVRGWFLERFAGPSR